MGNGRSKISTTTHGEFVPTEYGDNGADLDIDIDTELNERLVDRYETDRYTFDKDEEEIGELINNVDEWVSINFSKELMNDGSVEYSDGLMLIHDEDLRFTVYSCIIDLLKVQDKFNKITGSDEPLVDDIYFETSLKDNALGTHTEMSFDGGNTIVNHIDLLTNKDNMINYRAIYNWYEGSPMNDLSLHMDFLIKRNSFRDGWHSVSGTFQKSTLGHELGHAVFCKLKLDYPHQASKLSKIQKWFESTRSSPVSGYSQKNYDEAFAECFNLFINGGESSSRMYQEFKRHIAPLVDIHTMRGCLN